jgi:hypothetical protein
MDCYILEYELFFLCLGVCVLVNTQQKKRVKLEMTPLLLSISESAAT